MEDKETYLKAVVDNFNFEWKWFNERLRTEIEDGIRFSDVMDKIEKIHSNKDCDYEFYRLTGKSALYHDQYCLLKDAVKNWNIYFGNILKWFEGDDETDLVKVEWTDLDNHKKTALHYIVTEDSYGDCFIDRMKKRNHLIRHEITGISLCTLSLLDFVSIFDKILDESNYTEETDSFGKSHICFNNSIYDSVMIKNKSIKLKE